jgi:subtilisin-like proprotein convertase family protein
LGLARIAIAVLAVVLAFGLLIIGGIALWGALTGKDDKEKPGATASVPSAATKASSSKVNSPASGNTIEVKCLATQCPVFVAGPSATDVQFNGNLTQNEIRTFNGTRLTMAVQDASTVAVTINGHAQPRGARGDAKTYEAPISQ